MQTVACTLSSGSFTMTFRDATTEVRTRCALILSGAGCRRKIRVWRWSGIEGFICSGKNYVLYVV